jgi:EmrB/QacA subfamily drug resistance transporter
LDQTGRRRAALWLLCTAQFVLVLDVTIVAVALPSLRDSLGFSAHDLQWVVSAYVLAFAGCLLLAGRGADLWGRRRLFMAGLAIFAGASVWCGLARASWELVAARTVQGLGAALVAPAALSLLTTTFAEGLERDRALGVWTAAAAGGGATGFLLGGVLTQGLGWRAVFLVNLPVGVAGLLLARPLLPEGRATGGRRRLDLAGAVTVTGALVGLVFGLSRIEQAGPGSGAAWLPLAAAALLGGAFVAVERRASDPLVPLPVLGNRRLTAAALVALLLTAVTTPNAFFVVLHLRDVHGYRPSLIGLTVAPVSLAVVAGSLVGGRLVGRLGPRPTMAAGLGAIAAGSAALATLSPAASAPGYLVLGLVASGLGLGAAAVASTTQGAAAVAPDQQGLASGLLNSAAQLGSGLGLAVLVTVATSRAAALTPPGVAPTKAAVVDGYRWAILAGVAAAAAGALVILGRAALAGGRRPGQGRPGRTMPVS